MSHSTPNSRNYFLSARVAVFQINRQSKIVDFFLFFFFGFLLGAVGFFRFLPLFNAVALAIFTKSFFSLAEDFPTGFPPATSIAALRI